MPSVIFWYLPMHLFHSFITKSLKQLLQTLSKHQSKISLLQQMLKLQHHIYISYYLNKQTITALHKMFAGLNNHVNNSHLNLSQSNTQISRFNKSTRKIKSLSSPKCNKFILYTRSVHYSKRPSANQESANNR